MPRLNPVDHGMKRRVDDTTGESTGTTSGLAGSGFCSAEMLSSAAVRPGIAAEVVSSRAPSRLYSRVGAHSGPSDILGTSLNLCRVVLERVVHQTGRET